VRDAITRGDGDLYYFYCHGYTERLATDIQFEADLVAAFARWAEEVQGERAGSLREHLDDLFDVSDSWLRVSRGKIPLTMLKEAGGSAFSRHPLVFLNMCESAQVLPSLSDGFVPFFLQRGARAVVGTECAMSTVFADEFSRTFLTRFFRGERVGDILLALRRAYLDRGNPLALVYTLYSDADLHLDQPLLPADDDEEGAREGKASVTEDARWRAVEGLWQDDMEGLKLTLAARLRAAEEGKAHEALQQWDPPAEAFPAEAEAGPEILERMKALAERWWDKLEPQLYDLLCNEANPQHQQLMRALGQGAQALAVALAPALVAKVSALPAVAIVIATMVGKRIADTGLEAVCEIWSEARARAVETEA
jgi:hypothetical protein